MHYIRIQVKHKEVAGLVGEGIFGAILQPDDPWEWVEVGQFGEVHRIGWVSVLLRERTGDIRLMLNAYYDFTIIDKFHPFYYNSFMNNGNSYGNLRCLCKIYAFISKLLKFITDNVLHFS